MVHHSVISHLLIFCAWTAVVCIRIDADATTRSEDTCDLDILWIHKTDEVLHNLVYAVFVEVTVVAEREEVKFETLAFHHTLVREIRYAYLRKVWLTCDRAETCELRTVELYPVVILWVLVLECF